MAEIQVLGCYIEEDQETVVIALRKPCTFSEAMELLNEYIDEPTVTTWNENLDGIVVLSLRIQTPDEEASSQLPGIVTLINQRASAAAPGAHMDDGADVVVQEEGRRGPEAASRGAHAQDAPQGPEPARGEPPFLRRPYAPEPGSRDPQASSSTDGPRPTGGAKKKTPAAEARADLDWEDHSEWEWDPYIIQVLVPYGASYAQLVRHFSRFGPVDYCRVSETRPGPDGKVGRLCYIRYPNAADAQDAYDNSSYWRPRLVGLTKAKLMTTRCMLCGMTITLKHRSEHTKFCIAKRELAQKDRAEEKEGRPRDTRSRSTEKKPRSSERSVPEKRPAREPKKMDPPKQQASATVVKDQGTERQHWCVRPAKMATGPLVGTRLYKGYLSIFTHRFQMLTIVDEGQELIPPHFGALEPQLRQVYGTIDADMV